MNPRIVQTILFKELLDTLRDKRTLIAMIGVPLVLYPAIIILASQVALLQQSRLEETPSKVAIESGDAEAVADWLRTVPLIELVAAEDPRAKLLEGGLDAVVVVSGDVDGTLEVGETVPLEIAYDTTESGSRMAADRLEKALAAHAAEVLKQRLEARGLAVSFAKPIEIKRTDVAPPAKRTGNILGAVLPLLMIFMLAMGAFYPAVDLTAGEKERGTFETLLSTPTSKMEIVVGKFLTVCILSLITGFLNLASMGLTIWFQFSQVAARIPRPEGAPEVISLSIPPQSILAMGLVIVPLALFISALMMAVAVMARSFKEAQNYVTPVFILIALPASAGAFPDLDLPDWADLVPITNITLLFRDLMMDKASVEGVFTVFVSTAAYAVLALLAAAWLFQREEVVLSEERGVPLTVRRADFRPRPVPTAGMALMLLAFVMLLVFYAGAYAQVRAIVSGMILTQFGVILAPVLFFLWFAKIDLRTALNLRRPTGLSVAAALILCPAWVILSIQLLVWQNRVLPAPPQLLDEIQRLLELANTPGGLALTLFIIAVSPAICEEVLFRGALLSGLRERMAPWAAAVVVSVLFGLFHVSIYRFAPQALTGLILAGLVLRGGSIFPAMIFHFGFNALLTLVQLEKLPAGLVEYLRDHAVEQNGLPTWVLGAAGVVAMLAIAMLTIGPRSVSMKENPQA